MSSSVDIDYLVLGTTHQDLLSTEHIRIASTQLKSHGRICRVSSEGRTPDSAIAEAVSHTAPTFARSMRKHKVGQIGPCTPYCLRLDSEQLAVLSPSSAYTCYCFVSVKYGRGGRCCQQLSDESLLFYHRHTLFNMPRTIDFDFTTYETFDATESYWASKCRLFEAHGYALRPRYRPGWTPSWKGKPLFAIITAEDAASLHARVNVIDARRISDDTLVYLKKIRPDSEELQLLRHLSSPAMLEDQRNHCVPLLDVIYDPDDPKTCFVVMPFLRYINDPPFEFVEDMLECGEQILEGLVFLHDHGVAHRDCAFQNVMMDVATMYPKGFHPMATDTLPDMSAAAPVLHRVDMPVKYLFIDFGISTRFVSEQQPRLVLGNQGLDKEVPELSTTVPYDPFKTDVFIIGNLFHEVFLQKYSNVEMLMPLVERMVSRIPECRPDAAEALREWKAMRRRVPTIRRYWRLRPLGELWIVTLFYECLAAVMAVLRTLSP